MLKTLLSFRAKQALALFLLMTVLGGGNALFAQDCPAEQDEQENLMNYSLYYEFYKNKDYESAVPYMEWILKCAPGFIGPGRTDDRNFTRAVRTYQDMAVATEDATQQRELFDKALHYLDTAVSTLQDANVEVEESDWVLAKGRFLQRNANFLPDLQSEVGSLYLQVYEAAPEKLDPMNYYVDVIITHLSNQGDKAGAIALIDDVEANFGSGEGVMDVLTKWRDDLFDDPYERMAFLEGELEKKPGDDDIVGQLVDLYRDMEERDKLFSMLEAQNSANPSAKSSLELGVMYLEDGEAGEARGYFDSALEMAGEDSEIIRDANFRLGAAAEQLEQFSRARTHYRRAYQADDTYGQAVKAIADLYANTIRSCSGSKMGRGDQAVYWLVADYLERARSVDQNLTNQVNSALRLYRPLFPTAEDLFFMKLEAGQNYRVDQGCYSWIGETTRVRNPS